MDFERPKRSRRRIKIGDEADPAFIAAEFEVGDMPDTEPAEAEQETPEPVAPPPVALSRDIGNWLFRPWKGRDHWVNNKNSAWTSFDEKYVRKHRHLSTEPVRPR